MDYLLIISLIFFISSLFSSVSLKNKRVTSISVCSSESSNSSLTPSGVAKQIVHNLFTTPGGFYERREFATVFEKTLEENEISELNFTDPDAKTVKFGAHQGTDVGYNIQSAVDSKKIS
jgi:hypothetical protein